MKAATGPKRWLIADIGGTNSRLAIWQAGETARGVQTDLRKLSNAAYAQIDDMLGAFLDSYDGEPPTHAVLAIAGPVTSDQVRLLNIAWSFSANQLREQFGLTQLIVINDFEALAHVVPLLTEDDFIQNGDGMADKTAPALLIGPGTGLGVASVVFHDTGYIAVPGEGGHVSLPAANLAESRIIEAVQDRYGHCSAERILSGAGLCLLHDILHGDQIEASVISARAAEQDPNALATFEQFFQFLGTVAGDAALTVGALGGVYLGGGILPANQTLFLESAFRERFIDKGRYRGYLNAIPTRLITLDTPALVGLSGVASHAQ
ncbi:MAG: glucokinase [Woeseiaceae bacterium]